MSMNLAGSHLMVKELVFKKDGTGTGKKSGNPFRVIELHDPITLENLPCFIREENPVNTTGINFKDKVIASFGMDIVYGKIQMVLNSIKKA